MPAEPKHRFELRLRRIAFWLPLGICSWLALGSGLPSGVPKVSDISLHLLAFIYLTIALRIAHARLLLPMVVLAMLAYGGFIEVAQLYLPPREAEWKDFGVDAVGVSVGLLVHRAIGEKVWQSFLRLVRLER